MEMPPIQLPEKPLKIKGMFDNSIKMMTFLVILFLIAMSSYAMADRHGSVLLRFLMSAVTIMSFKP